MGCPVCMHIYALCVYSAPLGPKDGTGSPELELQTIVGLDLTDPVGCCVGAGN